MRKIIFLLLPIIAACKNNDINTPKDAKSPDPAIMARPPFECNYEAQKKRCKELFLQHRAKASRSTEKKLIEYISDSLLTCWYGTPWDFNGTTQQPQSGKIACGYFVTTVLKDAGLPIERVRLAQCASQQLIEATCTNISKYSNQSLKNFVAVIKNKGTGLDIAGLDNHTGFLLNDDKEIYFIHAGVYPPKCALKEKAIESVTLRNSKFRMVGKIKF